MSRSEPDLVHNECDVMMRFLDKMRAAVVRCLDGLDDEAARRPMVPSGTNLAGIVAHLATVEAYWFADIFAGESHVTVDYSMQVAPGRSVADVIAGYRAACARTDEIIAATADLSQMSARANPGEEPDALRRLIAHMIEETGRHAGHADIIRELIDGRVDS